MTNLNQLRTGEMVIKFRAMALYNPAYPWEIRVPTSEPNHLTFPMSGLISYSRCFIAQTQLFVNAEMVEGGKKTVRLGPCCLFDAEIFIKLSHKTLKHADAGGGVEINLKRIALTSLLKDVQ